MQRGKNARLAAKRKSAAIAKAEAAYDAEVSILDRDADDDEIKAATKLQAMQRGKNARAEVQETLAHGRLSRGVTVAPNTDPLVVQDDGTGEENVILESTRTIIEREIQLAVLDCDSALGVRARGEGCQEALLVVPEEEMLMILLRHGVSEEDLGNMEMTEIIERLLSFVDVDLPEESQTITLSVRDIEHQVENLTANIGDEPETTCLELLNVQTTHTKAVESVTVCDNGSYLVTGSLDKTGHLWLFPASSTELISSRLLLGHTDGVNTTASIGDWVCSGSRDNSIRVWNIESEESAQDPYLLEGHGDVVRSVQMYIDSENHEIRVVSASRDKTLKIWNVKTQTILHTLKGHEEAVACVSKPFALGGKTIIASGSKDKHVCIWNLSECGPPVHVLRGHTKAVICIASTISADGTHVILSGSSDKTVRIWSAKSGECVGVVDGFAKSVTQLCSFQHPVEGKNRNVCLVLTMDGKVGMIDVSPGSYTLAVPSLIGEPDHKAMNGAPRCIAVSKDGFFCFIGGQKGHLSKFRIRMSKNLSCSSLVTESTII